jgi:extracellular factor (EF) 3-hydroxypalmitic acid methyl ester biosynthesis protein
MDDAECLLAAGRCDEGMTHLTLGLQELRNDFLTTGWPGFSTGDFKQHPLTRVLHEDPFTRHAFLKPRNYSGDADLIDFMYGDRLPDSATTVLGRTIFEYTTKTPAPQSVKARRGIIASMIDEIVETVREPRILSIACGHLREAKVSAAVKNHKIKEFLALDQDALSLEVVRRELSEFNVKPVHSTIKSLFRNGHDLRNFDFVYAAGLFDYLSQAAATALTGKMFRMLNSGGRLLVANFAPTLRDIAYMETFMQWKLIYRTMGEVDDFTSTISPDEIEHKRLFWDKPGNVIYLEVIKK